MFVCMCVCANERKKRQTNQIEASKFDMFSSVSEHNEYKQKLLLKLKLTLVFRSVYFHAFGYLRAASVTAYNCD